ncbi:phosphomannomutase [Shewanella sp. 10N.286.48.B5]|uniref:phosphomannomutase n=1 Tax=Shewanella sp. 10N.286.48.B5 TaxID=1880834 RepID=UPI000C834D6A|nr:phosphomannomutase [Shewanella sp. 10N.286.48.B5]PMH86647.1 phosphomannomutase [Shewanella sp. 10N.286.48.B5]
MLNSKQVIASSHIGFGTSGARGLVCDFTVDVCAAFTVSFLNTMQDSFNVHTIAIAIDNRPSSFTMAQACAAALELCDVKVVYYGVIPTPALACISMSQEVPCIMVTGSHIPFDRNGLKFYRPDGEITKADEIAILNSEYYYPCVEQLPLLTVDNAAENHYIDRYVSLFDSPWLTGKRIGIYQHSSAGRDLYPLIFEKLGAEVISIGRSDTFVPIDTEAVSEADCQKAIEWTHEYQLDALFSTDGDGDRPLLADEQGNWLRGDILGLLSAKALDIDGLVVPVSCNTAIELSHYFDLVVRTKIGSPHVIAAFSEVERQSSRIAGFEANGGFLLESTIEVNGHSLTALPTRDAVLPVLMVLHSALSKTDSNSIAGLVAQLPQRFTHSDRLTDFNTERSKQIVKLGLQQPEYLLEQLNLSKNKLLEVNSTDGLRLSFTNGNIVHLRPSGNAPEFRCYAESDSISKAKQLVEHTLYQLLNINLNASLVN